MVPAKWDSGKQLLLLTENHPEEALCEAENKRCALVRVEPEKLAAETVLPQPSSGKIVIRAQVVEKEFPPSTDIGIFAAAVKALSHT